MNDTIIQSAVSQENTRPNYVAPVVRIMSETEVLSAFQVNATTSTTWWIC
jgi:hypothetical protein